jgi:O-antigen biosynthesis protein
MAERAGPHVTLAGRALPVTGADGADLRIDLAGAGLGGVWVSVT